MAEIKGALIMCDRCKVSAFTKLGDYNSVEMPHGWHRAHFGISLQEYNLCPECYEQLEFAKRSFFSEAATTQRGIILWREKDGN